MTTISATGEQILRLAIAMIILTGLATLLRFLTRVHSRASFAADDWWLLVALACFYTCMGLQIWSKLYVSSSVTPLNKCK